jgi:hypothetical protein
VLALGPDPLFAATQHHALQKRTVAERGRAPAMPNRCLELTVFGFPGVAKRCGE